jgi:hypothetical protein
MRKGGEVRKLLGDVYSNVPHGRDKCDSRYCIRDKRGRGRGGDGRERGGRGEGERGEEDR